MSPQPATLQRSSRRPSAVPDRASGAVRVLGAGAGRSGTRFRAGSASALLLWAPLAGCAAKEEYRQPVGVHLVIQGKTFRPGDAVVVKVTVWNLEDRPLRVPPLSAASGRLKFYTGPRDGEERLVRDPVAPQAEEAESPTLPPRGVTDREFVFTRITEEPGERLLQVFYEGAPRDFDTTGSGLVISKPAYFTVAGERRFRRDPEGLLLKEDAAALAREAAGPSSEVLSIRLLRDPRFGAFFWRATVRVPDAKGGPPREETLDVNPYLAAVWVGPPEGR